MRYVLIALLGLMGILGSVVPVAWSQEQDLRQPMAVEELSFAPGGVVEPASPSPSDRPLPKAAAPAPDVEPAAPAGDGCRCGCGDPCCCKCKDPSQPWTMPQLCILQKLGIKTGGWLEQGITFNSQDPPSGFNGPVGTNDWDKQYQMNQFWVFADRPVNTGGCGWDIGGHVDFIYGSDWRFGINHGLEDRLNALDQTYGLVVPQFYMDIGYNDLTVRMGHFAGPLLLYETIPAVLNPLYSHSYAMAFSQPILVTGLQADYKVTDLLSVQAGFHRGWMMFEDFNSSLDFMAGFKWTGPCKKASLAYALSMGPQDIDGRQDRFVNSLLFRYKMTDRFEYIFQHDLGLQQNTPGDGETAQWYGINQYLQYALSPKWKAIARIEWFRDDDGVIVRGAPPVVYAWHGGPGFAGNFYECTLGLNWRPHPNFLLRPEVRWDWYDGEPGVGGLPFRDGASDNQFLVGMDLVVTF